MKELVLSGLSVSSISSGALNFVSKSFISLSISSSLSLCTASNNVNPWSVEVSLSIWKSLFWLLFIRLLLFCWLLFFRSLFMVLFGSLLINRHNYTRTKRVFIYEEKHPIYSPVNQVPRLAGMIFNLFVGMNISRGIVLSLVQFDFSYSSAITTLNSAFTLGSSDSRSNHIKAICDL